MLESKLGMLQLKVSEPDELKQELCEFLRKAEANLTMNFELSQSKASSRGNGKPEVTPEDKPNESWPTPAVLYSI